MHSWKAPDENQVQNHCSTSLRDAVLWTEHHNWWLHDKSWLRSKNPMFVTPDYTKHTSRWQKNLEPLFLYQSEPCSTYQWRKFPFVWTILPVIGIPQEITQDLSSPSFEVTESDALISQGDILFKRFIELLSDSEPKERSVSYYAEQLCITPKYLSTTIKKVSGKTAFEWINEYVMEDVKRQLSFSGKSIKEIADYLKFPNISFFGKYVKTHLGVSPTEFRRQIQKRL